MTTTTSVFLGGRAVRTLGITVLVVGAAFTVTTLPGARDGHPGFWVPVDGWLQGTGYVLAAVLIVLRPVLLPEARLLWTLLAAAVTLRCLGYLVYFSYVRLLEPQPYPSISDPMWLGGSLLFIVAIARRGSYRRQGMSRLLALDGVIAGLTVGGVVVALLGRTLSTLTAPGVPSRAVAFNVIYPGLDVVALVLVAGLLASGWRPDRAEVVVAFGIAVFAAVECAYLYRLAQGTFRPGTLLGAMSMASTAAVSIAAWVRVPPPRRPHDALRSLPPRPSAAVPIALATICLSALLVMNVVDEDSMLAVAMLVLALAMTIVRGVLTARQEHDTAGAVIAAQQRERARFQRLVEASGDFVLIASLDGSVTFVNPAGRRMIGLEADRDVSTTTYDDYLVPEARRNFEQVEQPTVLEHGHWEGQSTLRDLRGGPPIPVTVASFLLHDPQTHEPFALATVQRDVSAMIAAEQAMAELAEQRKLLLERLVQAQEDERARIAADVHDDSVQALAAVDLRLGLARQRLADADADAATTASLERAHDAVNDATARLRHLLFDLDSPALRTDLASALGDAASFVLEGTGVRWRITGDPGPDLSPAGRITAYRVAQEALVNVRKHAGAATVELRLACPDGGMLLTVADDGRGIDGDDLGERPGHLGLSGMRDRAMVAGGHLEVRGAPGQGTELRLWLPRDGAARA